MAELTASLREALEVLAESPMPIRGTLDGGPGVITGRAGTALDRRGLATKFSLGKHGSEYVITDAGRALVPEAVERLAARTAEASAMTEWPLVAGREMCPVCRHGRRAHGEDGSCIGGGSSAWSPQCACTVTP